MKNVKLNKDLLRDWIFADVIDLLLDTKDYKIVKKRDSDDPENTNHNNKADDLKIECHAGHNIT